MKIKRQKTSRVSVNTKVIHDIKDPFTLGIYLQLMYFANSEGVTMPEGFLRNGLEVVEALEELTKAGYILDEGNHELTIRDLPDPLENEVYLQTKLELAQ